MGDLCEMTSSAGLRTASCGWLPMEKDHFSYQNWMVTGRRPKVEGSARKNNRKLVG